MAKASSIMRSSIHSFLSSYHTFASLAVLLVFPASAATLLSSSLIPSPSSSSPSFSLLLTVSPLLHSFLEATKFSFKSRSFTLLNFKLSQAIASVLFAPSFALTFLTLSKAYIIIAARKFPLRRRDWPSFTSILHLYRRLLLAHLFTGFITLSANLALFSLMLLAFSATSALGIAARSFILVLGAIIYSIISAKVLVIFNLASIISGTENCKGYTAVLKACLLIRGRASVASSLALCTNLAMAAVEALFQMRVTRPYHEARSLDVSLACEALTIIYMHSIVRVIDIIISCCFYNACKTEMIVRGEEQFVDVSELEEEEGGVLRV